MKAAVFCKLARRIAGPHWKTKLPPMIGCKRRMVYDYANGVEDVPETVAKLMVLLAEKAP
jgi:RNase adaptor protein for sRNA GlmZ degradation